MSKRTAIALAFVLVFVGTPHAKAQEQLHNPVETHVVLTTEVLPDTISANLVTPEPKFIAPKVQSIQDYAASKVGTSFAKLDYIVKHESNWDPKAANPTSTARGIGQLLDTTAAEILGHGVAYGELPATQQVDVMLEYIENRYGSIDAAYAFKLVHGWY